MTKTEILKSRKLTIKDVAHLFGIPPQLIYNERKREKAKKNKHKLHIEFEKKVAQFKLINLKK